MEGSFLRTNFLMHSMYPLSRSSSWSLCCFCKLCETDAPKHMYLRFACSASIDIVSSSRLLYSVTWETVRLYPDTHLAHQSLNSPPALPSFFFVNTWELWNWRLAKSCVWERRSMERGRWVHLIQKLMTSIMTPPWPNLQNALKKQNWNRPPLLQWRFSVHLDG